YIVFAIGPDTAKKNAEARVSRNPTMTERLILDLLKCWCAGGSDRGGRPRRGGSSVRRVCPPQRARALQRQVSRSGHVHRPCRALTSWLAHLPRMARTSWSASRGWVARGRRFAVPTAASPRVRCR